MYEPDRGHEGADGEETAKSDAPQQDEGYGGADSEETAKNDAPQPDQVHEEADGRKTAKNGPPHRKDLIGLWREPFNLIRKWNANGKNGQRDKFRAIAGFTAEVIIASVFAIGQEALRRVCIDMKHFFWYSPTFFLLGNALLSSKPVIARIPSPTLASLADFLFKTDVSSW